MAFGQGGQYPVLVVDERLSVKYAGLALRGLAMGQYEQRQGLVCFANRRNYRMTRPGPFDAFDIEVSCQIGKRCQYAFEQRTVPAVKLLAWIGGIVKAGPEKKKRVSGH